jgi:hypothetical protein
LPEIGDHDLQPAGAGLGEADDEQVIVAEREVLDVIEVLDGPPVDEHHARSS